MPVSQPSASRIACSSGATLRRPQQRSGSRSQSASPWVAACSSTRLQRAQRLDLEPVVVDEALARRVRLREQQARVDLDEARLGATSRVMCTRIEVPELPRARQHEAAAEGLGGELDELLGAQRLEVLGEPRDLLGGQIAGERWQSAHTHPSNQTRLSQPEGVLMRVRVARACPPAAAPGPTSPSSSPSGRPCQSDPPVGTRSSCAHSRRVNARCGVVVVGPEALDAAQPVADEAARRSARARRRPCAACTDARARAHRRSRRRARRPPRGRASRRRRRPAGRRRAGGRTPPASSRRGRRRRAPRRCAAGRRGPCARRATSSHSSA